MHDEGWAAYFNVVFDSIRVKVRKAVSSNSKPMSFFLSIWSQPLFKCTNRHSAYSHTHTFGDWNLFWASVTFQSSSGLFSESLISTIHLWDPIFSFTMFPKWTFCLPYFCYIYKLSWKMKIKLHLLFYLRQWSMYMVIL